MVHEILLLVLVTLVASGVGTLTGFGTSTIMVPLLLLFFPLSQTLLFVGIIHWFGDVWKMILFRGGVQWRLIFLFGGGGVVASYFGAALVPAISSAALARWIGGFLLVYVVWLVWNRSWQLPNNARTALFGGAVSGFLAGIFGIGGAVRAAALVAFNLPKSVYLFTNGAIAFVIDSTRLTAYTLGGERLSVLLLWALLFCIPASLIGAYGAKYIVGQIPEKKFRLVVALFIGLVALKLLVWP